MNLEDIESGVVINDWAAAGDGGSLSFICQTNKGIGFTLLFTQTFFLDFIDPEMLPGRIYLDGQLIPINGKEEKAIFDGLRHFKYEGDESDNDLSNTFSELETFYTSNKVFEVKQLVDKNLS